jgi:hypothetical protein
LVDFGRVPQGDTVRRTLQLRNPGTQAVALQTLRATGPNAARFSVEAPCLAARRLEAGAVCEVDVLYRPTTLERHEAWIEFASDATHPTLVRLSGLGDSAPPPAPAPAPTPAPTPPPPAATGSGGGGGGTMSWAWLLALFAIGLALRPPRR